EQQVAGCLDRVALCSAGGEECGVWSAGVGSIAFRLGPKASGVATFCGNGGSVAAPDRAADLRQDGLPAALLGEAPAEPARLSCEERRKVGQTGPRRSGHGAAPAWVTSARFVGGVLQQHLGL